MGARCTSSKEPRCSGGSNGAGRSGRVRKASCSVAVPHCARKWCECGAPAYSRDPLNYCRRPDCRRRCTETGAASSLWLGCRLRRGLSSGGCRRGLPVVASSALSGIRAIAQLFQPLVEGLDCSLALFQQIVDERLFTLLHRLLLSKEFLDSICPTFFRHSPVNPPFLHSSLLTRHLGAY